VYCVTLIIIIYTCVKYDVNWCKKAYERLKKRNKLFVGHVILDHVTVDLSGSAWGRGGAEVGNGVGLVRVRVGAGAHAGVGVGAGTAGRLREHRRRCQSGLGVGWVKVRARTCLRQGNDDDEVIIVDEGAGRPVGAPG
jgi:hypothetical protein